MTDYSIKKTKSKYPERQAPRPTSLYPELVKRIARAKVLVDDLHKVFNTEEVAGDLTMKKQSLQHHMEKVRKEKKA